MEPNNKPRAREKKVTEGGKGVHKRGDGLGTGPVGSADGYSGKSSGGAGGSGGGINRAVLGGGIGLPILIIIIVVLVFKFGGASGGSEGGGLFGNSTLPSGFGGDSTTGYSDSAAKEPDRTVAAGSREKYTKIKGNGQDKITFMVYMCGTDLESKYSMATADLTEMASSSFGDNIEIIVCTGGCSNWKTQGISNKVNQIYRVRPGGLDPLVQDFGTKAMTDQTNLAEFIKYCKQNYPADRNELILWDHGGGSVSGYGYDEKNKSKGSMGLSELSKALKAGGVKFDFIGFDACLMATAETALMCNEYADYLIASEETEPGIGWYYTNWLTKLGQNTSMPTIDIGKNIVDDFVTACASKCKGQQTTLSVIDLAEFANTVPPKLSSFSGSVSTLIDNKDFQTVSDARYATREFARSSKIDQVDLVNLAENMNTDEGKALSDAIKGAVKYNRTSSNMTNAYGVSIYFPYQRTSYVDTACSTYDQIGMDSAYAKCIRQFASLETSGQIAAGGTSNPLASLFGGSSSGTSGGSDAIGSLLQAFLGGGGDRSIDGLDSGNTAFMTEGDTAAAADYISMNYFDTANLSWETEDDTYYLDIPESQWKLIHKLDLNMFYDDGAGYVDLGLDNIYSFSDNKLIADTDGDWLSVNGQPIAYYHTDTVEEGDKYTITGYSPAMLNGERVRLIIVFDNENPDGYIAGAVTDYNEGETETVAKSMTELNTGDKLEFLCDYYTYDGAYSDTYYLGEAMTVSDNMELSNTKVGSGKLKLTYCFTDIYNNTYWSEAIEK
ncbi:MAG: peptidase C11 [Ruminococcus sp.]|nr:peptidase C11 [Ruminococcus sp.]